MQPDRVKILRDFWDAKAGRESLREAEDPAKRIHTDLLWRAIRRLADDGARTVLDAGGGTGRFSLRLASQGLSVTHLDLSDRMLALARDAAAAAGVAGVSFVEGTIEDLRRFEDRAFDLVLCLDAPLSFCFDGRARALDELARVSKRDLLLCVLNRTGIIASSGIAFDLRHFGVPRTSADVFRTGDLEVTPDLERLQRLMPSWHAFTPEELRRDLAARSFEVTGTSAPGSLCRFVSRESLESLVASPGYEEYLAFEERFDAQDGVLGLGSGCAGGLLVSARRR